MSEPARYWYWQVQVQILCAGLSRVHVVVLDPSLDLQTFVIEPCPEDQARIFEIAQEFLSFTAQGKLPPDVDLGYEAAAALYPEITGEFIDLDDETAHWCRILGSLKGRIQRLQGDEDRLKAMIARRLGEAAEGRYDGRTMVTWRQVTRTDIDRKRLRSDHPELAKKYATSTKYRALRLKGAWINDDSTPGK
jgi:predicted phage-related endonuclease